MRVKLLCFAEVSDLFGRESNIEVADGATVGDLLTQLIAKEPRLERFVPSLLLTRNEEYCERDSVIKSGDEIGLLPPVSGG